MTDPLFDTRPYRSGKPGELAWTSRPDPVHVHEPGAPKTRCGISMKSDDRFPYVGAAHVQMHVEGRQMVVCPGCLLTEGITTS